MQLIDSLADIAGDYDAVLCDLWGCLHDGKVPFPAAVAALQAFRAGRGRVILVTNAPRPRGAIAAMLDAMGVPRDAWDAIVTSGDAAQAAMLTGAVGFPVHHIGAPKDEPFFTEADPAIAALAAGLPAVVRVPMDQAEGVVCTGLADDLTETPEDYRLPLMQAHARGLPLLCANPDIVVHFGDRTLWCAGALARDYEAMGGRALYFGKPHPPIYELARAELARLGAPEDPRLLAIGDGLPTDILGGQQEGIDRLLVTAGIHHAELGPTPDTPDPARIAALAEARGIWPTHAIPRLR
jgi:HAD superfamily hydrolase (TIGR01459 family)